MLFIRMKTSTNLSPPIEQQTACFFRIATCLLGWGSFHALWLTALFVLRTAATFPQLQKSLGLGAWSYVGLGTAIFVLVLNNTLGLGWLGRLFGGDFDTEGIVDVEGQRQQQVQVMQLDGDSNLLR